MQRDISLDSIRGLLVLYITAGHLMMTTFTAFPKLRDLLLYPLGYFQVITAFIFVSGIVVGKIGAMALNKRGMGVILRTTRDRVVTIYLAHLLVVTWVAVSIQFFPQMLIHARLAPFAEDFWISWVKGALLLIQPSFVDILPIYLFATLMVPGLLWLISHRLTIVALLISVAMWAYGQTEPQLALQNSLGYRFYIDLGRFEFFSWQLVYVLAVVAGYHSYTGFLPRLFANKYFAHFIFGLTSLALATLLMVRWQVIEIPRFPPNHWINLRALSWFCLLNFLIAACFVYRLVAMWPGLFQWRLCAFLGRHGIWVFSYHCLVVFTLLVLRPQLMPLPKSVQFVVMLACLASLYIPAYIHERYQQHQKNKRTAVPSVARTA